MILTCVCTITRYLILPVPSFESQGSPWSTGSYPETQCSVSVLRSCAKTRALHRTTVKTRADSDWGIYMKEYFTLLYLLRVASLYPRASVGSIHSSNCGRRPTTVARELGQTIVCPLVTDGCVYSPLADRETTRPWMNESVRMHHPIDSTVSKYTVTQPSTSGTTSPWAGLLPHPVVHRHHYHSAILVTQ